LHANNHTLLLASVECLFTCVFDVELNPKPFLGGCFLKKNRGRHYCCLWLCPWRTKLKIQGEGEGTSNNLFSFVIKEGI